jgi:hypothetical protein
MEEINLAFTGSKSSNTTILVVGCRAETGGTCDVLLGTGVRHGRIAVIFKNHQSLTRQETALYSQVDVWSTATKQTDRKICTE